MDFIYGNEKNSQLNKVLCAFVAQRIFGHDNDFGPSGSLGICKVDKVIAAVVFHNWQPDYGVIEISAAADSPKWLSRRSIREIMSIVFEQHKCQQLVMRTAVENERSIKICTFLKFHRILLPNMRGKGRHEFLFMLTRDEWAANKLNEVKNGKSKDPVAA